MKKVVIIILLLFFCFFGICNGLRTNLSANEEILNFGSISCLSNEKINYELIDVYELKIDEIKNNNNYILIKENNNRTVNVDTNGKFNINDVESYSYKINLNSLPNGYGVLYNNCLTENYIFYIDEVSEVKSFVNNNEINFKFYNCFDQEITIDFSVDIINICVTSNSQIVKYSINANNKFFYLDVEVENDIFDEVVFTDQVSDVSNIQSDNSFSYSNTLNYQQQIIEEYSYNFNENLTLLYNFNFQDLSGVNQIYQSIIANVNSCFYYFSDLGFLTILDDYFEEDLQLTLNFFNDESQRNNSNFNNQMMTLNFYISENVNDLDNVSVIIHEITHFILSINSSIVYYANQPLLTSHKKVVSRVFNESIATFIEFHYLFIEKEFQNENNFLCTNELLRLSNFANSYFYQMYFDCLRVDNLNVLDIGYQSNIVFNFFSNASLMGNFDYYGWIIFYSIYKQINDDFSFFDKLLTFLLNYDFILENEYNCNINKFLQYNEITAFSLYTDIMFTNLIEEFGLECKNIKYKLFSIYLNGIEDLISLEIYNLGNLIMNDYSRQNVDFCENDFLLFNFSSNYLSINFSEELKILIYDDSNNVIEEIVTDNLKLVDISQQKDYFVLIYNDYNFDISFDYEYYHIKNYNQSTTKVDSNSDFTSYFVTKFDENIISKFDVSIEEENEDCCFIVEIYSLITGLKVDEIQLDKIFYSGHYYFLEGNEFYIIKIKIILYSEIESQQSIFFNLIEEHESSGNILVNDYYFLSEVDHESLGIFFKYNFEAYGKYQIVVAIKNKELIYSDFKLYIVNENQENKCITLYEKTIQTNNASIFINIDVKYGDAVYVILPNSYFFSNVYFETYLNYNYEETFEIIPDLEGNSTLLYGSEVNINNGQLNSNVITVGFSRCLFLGDNAPSKLRENYYWFSTNQNIVEVSKFGTVLAKTIGNAYIYAVNKNDPSIIGLLQIFVVDDLNEEDFLLSFGFDVRKNGPQCGTDVSENNQTPYDIANYTQTFNLHVGKTKLICLGSDSPSPYLQHFNWVSNDESIGVSGFGTILGLKITGRECTVTGTYKYNQRFKVIIKLIVV